MADRLRLLFCDHLNLARGKILPASKIGDDASRFCQGVFAVSYEKDLIPSPGSMMLEGLPDMEARYLAADIREGWEPGTKVVVGDLWGADGTPLGMCGRGALRRAVAGWQARGLTPKVGIELEAYAFHRDDTGRLVPIDTPGAHVYATGRFADPHGFLDAIWWKAEAAGFRLEVMTSEYDAPQFEFTLRYDEAVRAVDDIFLFRLLARETALDHGIVLTFLPKPVPGKGGSGVHVNFSFADRDGRNAVANGERGGPAHLNDLARGCIAGLMHHHRGMAALVAPLVNSYQRLQPATLSGYWRNWGGDHRGVTTRISSEGGAHARIEHRMADGGANPYTLVATVLQAARLGVTEGYALPPMETGDCFETIDAADGVPDTLAAALDALALDAPLMDAVGRLLCENLIYMKRHEVERTADLSGELLRDYYIHRV
jgi:glutamine synthetase